MPFGSQRKISSCGDQCFFFNIANCAAIFEIFDFLSISVCGGPGLQHESLQSGKHISGHVEWQVNGACCSAFTGEVMGVETDAAGETTGAG